jgi:hypothetical protein
MADYIVFALLDVQTDLLGCPIRRILWPRSCPRPLLPVLSADLLLQHVCVAYSGIALRDADAAETWFEENDSEGVAFEYEVLE